MYLVITEFNRPSEDVPYYIDTNPELKEEFLKFTEANNGLFNDMHVINAGKKQTTILFYPDEKTFNEFMELFNSTFPTFFIDRDSYCQANNITISRTVEQL
jgi:hypothetical protein